MSSRTRTLYRNLDSQYYNWTQSNGSSGSIHTMDYDSGDIMDDVVIPKFKERSLRGEVFNNPMSHRKYSWGIGSGTRTAEYLLTPPSSQTATGDIVGYFLKNDDVLRVAGLQTGKLDSSAKRDNAIITAASRIDKTPYAMMEDLFEVRESIKLLRDPLMLAKDLTKIYRRKRNTLIKRGVDSVEAASTAWLSVRYGYRPVISTAMKLFDSWQDRSPAPPIRRTSRSTYQHRDNQTGMCVINNRTYQWNINRSVSGRVGILYTDINPCSGWQWKYGLRSKDIPKNIWAVMPYTWVSDRFIDIGSFIGAFTNLVDPSISVLSAWTTEDYSYDEIIAYVKDDSPNWKITLSTAPRTFKWHEKSRTPIPMSVGSLPMPKLVLDSLGDIQQVADLFSLIGQRLR